MEQVDSSQRSICHDYKNFEVCPNGNNCRNAHSDTPYRTETKIATIAWYYLKVAGKVEFILENGQNVTYFIPNGEWHNARAKLGDVVKLQVSEYRKKYHTARIVEVLCINFVNFSDCKYGAKCKLIHYCTEEQSFCIAKILSIAKASCALEVEVTKNRNTRQETIHVPFPDFWHLKNAAAGNLVILQKSARRDCSTRRNFGKIISVLHEPQASGSSLPFPSLLQKKLRNGFAIDQFQGRQRDIVLIYSMEECRDLYHQDRPCQRIGIHIFAGALTNYSKKIDEFFVPQHRENEGKINYESFCADTIRIAISLYTHSAFDKVDGPMLTPVFLPRGSIINLDAGETMQSEIFEVMWNVFGEGLPMGDDDETRIAGYVVNCPNIWKTKYLICKMRDFANKQLTMYLQNKTTSFAIARNEIPNVAIPDREIVVPVEIANTGLNQLPGNERKIALATMRGFAKRSANNFWGQHPKDAHPYVYDVIPCNDIPESKIVFMTSPLGQTTNYINQQILLSQMISPGSQLYSKNELLGIMVLRFKSPALYKVMVTEVAVKESIELSIIDLHICGIMKQRQGNLQLRVGEMFKGAKLDYSTKPSEDDDAATDSDSISFLLKGLTCDEYCNTKLVALPGKCLAALHNARDVFGAESSERMKRLQELDGSKIEFAAPYEKDGQNTKVTLRNGVQLQLQKCDDFLRLLKIGKDFHLCLLHLTSPISAFRSERVDTNELISRSSLEEMKIAIKENRMRTSILKGISIRWENCYFSGGAFNTNTKIKRGDLLCIRKEISGFNFIWICHGVVSKVSKEVEFLVCGLQQDQTESMFKIDDETEKFIIEVIEVTTEEASSSSSVFSSTD